MDTTTTVAINSIAAPIVVAKDCDADNEGYYDQNDAKFLHLREP